LLKTPATVTCSCSGYAMATTTCEQKAAKTKEKRKHHIKQNIKATSMHMEVRALFGRNSWRDDITNNLRNRSIKVHFPSEAVRSDNRAVPLHSECLRICCSVTVTQ